MSHEPEVFEYYIVVLWYTKGSTKQNVFLCHFCLGILLSYLCRLMSRFPHTDGVYNSGIVWGRLSHVHPVLLQEEEVTVSVATDWDTHQIPFPTKGNTLGPPQQEGKHGCVFVFVINFFCC